jgi:predicted GH43/DUF377 family glycosyl hydrolase
VSDDPALVRRGDQLLVADPRRVVSRLFLPGQETLPSGISRADAVIRRVLAMSDADVEQTLTETVAKFADRHYNLTAILIEHYELVAHRLPEGVETSPSRRELIGAFFTQEYSVEAAALLNPSIVAHPDQSGLAPGELRFIMSARAVGEGHISSIEFRTGTVTAGPEIDVRIDDPGRHLLIGVPGPAPMTREFLRAALADVAGASDLKHVLGLLPARFETADLDAALASVRRDRLTRGSADALLERIRWIASCNYRVSFPADRPLSERVLHPISPDESHGIEDARFIEFVEDDGRSAYYATYTAFDGVHVAPRLLHTEDFQIFESTQLIGAAAKNKGMALFPRRIDGKFYALSRWDRESIGVAHSPDGRSWGSAATLQIPEHAWELIQLGNCGSPLETSAGWLVLTHGVGPMRAYGMGAILLDLDDPTRLIGALNTPMLTPTEDERDGYVPNVVYSCGALIHADTLVLPYGCSDSAIRFAFVDLPALLTRLSAAL